MISAAHLKPRIKALRRIVNQLKVERGVFDQLGLFGDADELTEIRNRLMELAARVENHRRAIL